MNSSVTVKSQYIAGIENLIDSQLEKFEKNASITNRNSIPSDGNFPLNSWYKIPDVICLYVDIRNSTGLSATSHDCSTASVYKLFTGTAVRIFHEFEAPYVDVSGDGVFAVFNSTQPHRAIATAVTFKTFAENIFMKKVNAKIKNVDIGVHIGLDTKTVLVKQIGIKDHDSRDSRKNEVWAGKPINMAAKLAAMSKDDELWCSERFYNLVKDSDLVTMSCGCSGGEETGVKSMLWTEKNVSQENKFDFDKAYILKSQWCKIHGKEWCEGIINLDG